MILNDSISDFLTRIRNAMIVKSDFVLISFSKLICAILEILKVEKIIKNFKFLIFKTQIYILVRLVSTLPKTLLSLKQLRRISKPSLKFYITKNQKSFPDFSNLSRFSFFLVSTSYGLMTSRTAKMLQIGGELLFQIEFY